jgi:hypothetical protein
MNESEFTKEEAEAMLRGFRAETGSPVYVPPSLYAAAKKLGLDMTNVEAVKPIPLR